jgi:hypothetical protein
MLVPAKINILEQTEITVHSNKISKCGLFVFFNLEGMVSENITEQVP